MTEPVSPPAPVTVPPYPALGSADFNSQAYAYGSAMPAVAANINAAGDAAYTNAVAAKEQALAASASEQGATNQADAAMGYRNTASAHAATAGAKAGEAAASATTAQQQADLAATALGQAELARDTAQGYRDAALSARNDAAQASNAAQGFRDQAEVFATQQLKASSTTSLTPGAGSKTFAVEAGRSFVAGMYLVATSSGAPANKMSGTVVSYDSATGVLVIGVDAFAGAAARADWVIGVAASPSGQATPYANTATATTAVPYGRYRLTASLGLTLPASPADGVWVDVVNTSGTTTARILRNAQNINGLAEDLTIDANYAAFRLVYRTGYGWFTV